MSTHDVVVIGAGLAGLTAAVDLTELGLDVLVVEARTRVGGRTVGVPVAPGRYADGGAAYLGARHTELLALLSRYDLATTATPMPGDGVFLSGTDRERGPSRLPPLSAVGLGELFDALYELTGPVDITRPWMSPDAKRLDRLTAADWAEDTLRHRDSRAFFPLLLSETMAADPADVSVLHMAFYLKSGGGLSYLNAFEGGAQEWRVDGGAHRVCAAMAAELGTAVVLDRPVLAVNQDEAGTEVLTAHERFTARAVVLAVPPLLADDIASVPPPTGRALPNRTKPGCAVKVHLVYPHPVWSAQGLSGWSLSVEGPLTATVDESPSDGGIGLLTGLVTGAHARRFSALTPRERRQAVDTQLRLLFPEIPPPIDYHETDWLAEPYSRGCYAALLGPGEWLERGPALRAAHGRVVRAGTETATEFFGFMEGAVRSGHRAAREITTSHLVPGR